ncbi:DUF1761 domain-containing protein [Roseitalea porphyridii]|uniref:DUF1761 domain-containing protein n=1 Tax=Roseitalea porphyridii TaxID=1852022 RepID=A0A4P6V6P5_9HYPH|nr:DUF1761 domain-containing protein [Roseitalea porphyridii]QBK32150.1 DUF1761 domain-containing protein [Roseitalea porphyridii]
MDFGGINLWAVLAATVAAFIVGAVYYGTLSKPWMRAAGIAVEDAAFGPALFAMTFVCLLVMAFVLAGLIGHLGDGQVTLRNGVISGLFVWAGFMATTMTINHRYQNDGWDLTLIDGLHWLLVAVVMGAVIGLIGV